MKTRARRTPAQARASRANGSKGSRPRSVLPAELVEKLGRPPATPREIRIWNARILTEIQWLAMRGEIDVTLAASLRAGAGAIDRALPAEPPPPPRRYADDEPDDEEDRDGPELDDVASVGIRVGE